MVALPHCGGVVVWKGVNRRMAPFRLGVSKPVSLKKMGEKKSGFMFQEQRKIESGKNSCSSIFKDVFFLVKVCCLWGENLSLGKDSTCLLGQN